MLNDNFYLIVHLGDYIYEGPGRDHFVRKHVGDRELDSLDDYRARHAQYKTDAHLQAAHASCPWLLTWDDHEFDNNYASDIPSGPRADRGEFVVRRANAYQAYYEMMPLRRRSIPRGPDMRLYRKASFGRLAELLVLDTRQYRTDHPNGDRLSPLNEAALNPNNTMMGRRQQGWLKASLLASQGTWNVLAQQVMMGMVDLKPGEEEQYSMDSWPGYAAERIGLVEFLANRRVPNPVVLTGDIHSNWVNDLRVDDRKAELPVVATEFVGTSISTGGNGPLEPKNQAAILAENPCVRFRNVQRGYVRCTVTPESWRSDYIVVEDITKPGEPAVTRASFAIESGRPGVQPA